MRALKMACNVLGANCLAVRAPSIAKSVTVLFRKSAEKRFLEFGFALPANRLLKSRKRLQAASIAVAARTANSGNAQAMRTSGSLRSDLALSHSS